MAIWHTRAMDPSMNKLRSELRNDKSGYPVRVWKRTLTFAQLSSEIDYFRPTLFVSGLCHERT